jgi:hypothetical protein
MKKIFFITLFFFFSYSHSQVLTGYRVKFSPSDGFSFPAIGQFISPESKHDTLYFVDNGTHHLLFPQSGSVGSFISVIVDSNRDWINTVKSNDTLYLLEIYYADSAGNSHKTDTLVNIYQNVWQRTNGSIASLVYPNDSVVVGGGTYSTYFGGSKMQIRLFNNTNIGLAFIGDSGSVDLTPMMGRMNNKDLWRLKHYAAANSLILEYLTQPGGTVPASISLASTGIGINTVSTLDLFTVAGNTSIGGFSFGMTGSNNLRTRGFLYAGLQGAETNTQPNNVIEGGSLSNDIVNFMVGAQTDTLSGTHEAIVGKSISPFTSSSPQAIYTIALNWNITYNFELTAIMRPSNKTGEYFSKKIFVTASNDSGTIVFDSTTIATQSNDPFSVFTTCDFTVSTSGNNLIFNVSGSATNETHFIVTGRRSYTK